MSVLYSSSSMCTARAACWLHVPIRSQEHLDVIVCFGYTPLHIYRAQ